jgi:FkbM family methyltransferase
LSDQLRDLLHPERLTAVLDIGANPIDGDPPYKRMLAAGLCTVAGFEPQPEALAELNRRKGPNERYFPDAIGDGDEHTLYLCRAPGMTSTLEPNPKMLALFNQFSAFGHVEKKIRMPTRRLDDIPDLGPIDFLKIDIQGGELAAIRHGKRALVQTVAIQTEVSFVTLYHGQPTLGEIDIELRQLGFMPHCFADLKLWPLAPTVIDGNPRRALRQLIDADMVYVRDLSEPKALTGEQWKQLAMIAHHCYRSIDLATRAIIAAVQIGALAANAVDQYMNILRSPAART